MSRQDKLLLLSLLTLSDSGTSTEWKAGYDHSQDNSQAHTDYITNNADDIMAGNLSISEALTASLIYRNHIELGSTTSNYTSGADAIGYPCIGSPTYSTVGQILDLINSAGRASGGAVSAKGIDTVSITAGTGFIKTTDDDTAELLSFDWVAADLSVIGVTSYIGVDYNAGSPTLTVTATQAWDLDTNFELASVVSEGGEIHILNDPWWVYRWYDEHC